MQHRLLARLTLVSLVALAVALPAAARPVQLIGDVESLPEAGLVGAWVVSGVAVTVEAATTIDQTAGAVAIGSRVKVVGTRTEDALLARAIRVLDPVGGDGLVDAQFLVLRLLPTADAPGPRATGQLVARSFAFGDGGVREDIRLMLAHLAGGTAYDVWIDGVQAGTVMTNRRGMAHLFLSSAEVFGALPLPADLQPVMERQRIEVLDGDTVVLEGEFANARRERGHQPVDYLAGAVLTSDGAVVGMAMARARGDEQELGVWAHRLPPAAPVRIVVDGFELAPVVTSPLGHLRVSYASLPDRAGDVPLPAELQPVSGLLHLELVAEDGAVLAAGDFHQAVEQKGTEQTSSRRRLKR